MQQEVYVLWEGQSVVAVVSNLSFARQWIDSHPTLRGYQQLILDGDIAALTRKILHPPEQHETTGLPLDVLSALADN